MKIPEKSLPTGEFRSLCCLNGFPKRERYRITYISVPDVRILGLRAQYNRTSFSEKKSFPFTGSFLGPKDSELYRSLPGIRVGKYKFNGASTGFEPMASALALKYFTRLSKKGNYCNSSSVVK